MQITKKLENAKVAALQKNVGLHNCEIIELALCGGRHSRIGIKGEKDDLDRLLATIGETIEWNENKTAETV